MSPPTFSLDYLTISRRPNKIRRICHFCLKLMATRSVVDSKRLIYRDHLAGERDAGSPGSVELRPTCAGLLHPYLTFPGLAE
jgi:hypothetical protein